jgi:pSer/pThr/pTyr-binding forkhead associated (FHA) protein
MKDGRTRKLARHEMSRKKGFLAAHSATLVFASGPLAGTEVALDQERLTLGRGGRADVSLDDASVSHEHAVVEVEGAGFRIRDLGSTNGIRLNGSPVLAAELKHGDRVEIGSLAFRYRVEARAPRTPTHHVDED